MDIVGPLPTSSSQRQFLLVTIDYFSKWIEAEPLAQIKGKNVWNFLWKSIVCQFGISQEITIDNGTQFESREVEDYVENWKSNITFQPPLTHKVMAKL